MPEDVPATWLGIVAEAPLAALEKIKPAVLNVLEQLLATTQLTPSGQHLRGFAAIVCSPESVTDTTAPLVAAVWVNVVLAMPEALKVTVLVPKLPALVVRLALVPLAEV